MFNQAQGWMLLHPSLFKHCIYFVHSKIEETLDASALVGLLETGRSRGDETLIFLHAGLIPALRTPFVRMGIGETLAFVTHQFFE